MLSEELIKITVLKFSLGYIFQRKTICCILYIYIIYFGLLLYIYIYIIIIYIYIYI